MKFGLFARARARGGRVFCPLRARTREVTGAVSRGRAYRQPVRASRRAAVGIDATSSIRAPQPVQWLSDNGSIFHRPQNHRDRRSTWSRASPRSKAWKATLPRVS